MKRQANSSRIPFEVLNSIREKDANIIGFFTHASKQVNTKPYKETQYFSDDEFIFSKFKFVNIGERFHAIIVTENPEKSRERVEREFEKLKIDYSITINILNKETFEREAFSVNPKAIKTIILFNEICLIKGSEYFNIIKKKVFERYISPIDTEFQSEMVAKDQMLKCFADADRDCIIIYGFQYKKLFPYIYESLTNNEKFGFPSDRYKLVFPNEVTLKDREYI
jgi:hypothetical protein